MAVTLVAIVFLAKVTMSQTELAGYYTHQRLPVHY